MSAAAGHFASSERQRAAAELGMWVFLATELMFFGPLFLGYAYGRVVYGAAFAAASAHTYVGIGTANTAILLTSSLFVALAVRAVQLEDSTRAARWLWIAAALGATFLILKGVEYWLEWREQLVPWLDFRFAPAQAQGAGFFYYLYFATTGLHAVHLSIGIAVLCTFAWRLRASASRSIAVRLEMGGLYWHFVDAVWVVLYPILYLVERHG